MERDITNKELIKELIYTNPLALLAFKDKESIAYIDSFIPYSTGFEIECNSLDHFNAKEFLKIPDIIHVSCDSSEKRFRIPNGLKGIICLSNITNILPIQCSLNMGSGIHYHIDCTDVFKEINNAKFIKENNDWIIRDLILWNTAKEVNANAVVSQHRAWVRLADEHQTIEFRIGEMSFDYTTIITRIIDCNRIVKLVKDACGKAREVIYGSLDVANLFNYLKSNSNAKEDVLRRQLELILAARQEELQKLNTKPIKPVVDVKAIIRNRTQKIN